MHPSGYLKRLRACFFTRIPHINPSDEGFWDTLAFPNPMFFDKNLLILAHKKFQLAFKYSGILPSLHFGGIPGYLSPKEDS